MKPLLDDWSNVMDKDILDGLLGPFSMETLPVRDGFFVVTLKGTPQAEMWYWNGSEWVDSDDGLGENHPAELASGWYGTFQPAIETEDVSNDGLGA
jgi:hypothetical protein